MPAESLKLDYRLSDVGASFSPGPLDPQRWRKPDAIFFLKVDEVDEPQHIPVVELNVYHRVATPSRIDLGSLAHPELRLRTPLILQVEREGETVSVWNEDLQELGYGRNLGEAIEDFQKTAVELYRALREDQDRLGPEMQRTWSTLQGLIEVR